MVRMTITAALLTSAACTPHLDVCYSEGGMTRGDAKQLAIYTESLFQPLPSGDVAAVALGRGQIQAARVSPCPGKDGYLARTPPDSVMSVTFDPPSLARYESSRFMNDLILIDFTALEEGDGEIIVRAVFDGDEIEDRRPFRVRALGDVYYKPVQVGSNPDFDGPLVAGAELASFIFPTTSTGEPMVSRTPPGWVRPDGLLEIADYPWPADTDVAVKFPVAGIIPIRRGNESDWSYERTIDATTIEVVPTTAITASTFAEVSIPAIATSCGVGQGFIAETTLTDGGGRMVHGAAPLVVPSDANALEIHLGEDPDEIFVRCKVAGDYRLDLALPGAPKSLMVHIP